MRLCFAYGANMDVAAVGRMCPTARPLGPGRLPGYAFRIARLGFATVVPAPGAVVHGLVWSITPRDEASLDAYEEVDRGLYVKRFAWIETTAGRRRALVYRTATDAPGRPRPGYMRSRVVPAAEALGLPVEYLRELSRWAALEGHVPGDADF